MSAGLYDQSTNPNASSESVKLVSKREREEVCTRWEGPRLAV